MIIFDGAILNESNIAYAFVSYSEYSNKWILKVQMIRGGDITFSYDSEVKANNSLDSLISKIK